MLPSSRFILGFMVCVTGVTGAAAQVVALGDPPALYVPLCPPTQKELDQRQALHLFAEGVLCEREDRLLEAMRIYEQAAQLDPEAVSILKALVMIYIAVDRHDDASALLRKVLELDPDDFEMSYLEARHLRARGKIEEACSVLARGLQAPALKSRPDRHQQMEYDLGILLERLEKYDEAGAAFSRAVAIVDHPDGLLQGLLSEEEIEMRSAEMYERAGRNFLDAGKYAEAAAAFQKAQAKFPAGAGRLHYHLAQVNLKQGKAVEALAALDQYLRTLPQGTEAYELKIGLLQKLRRDAEILPWLEQASTQDRFNIGLRLLWARQCAAGGQAAKAEKIYRDLADNAPSEQVYRDLFLLYKDHHAQGLEAVVKLVNSAIEASARKDNLPPNTAGPAQARAMVGALRENADLARAVLKTAGGLAGRQPLHLDTLQIFAAIADRLELLPEAEIFYHECIKQPLPAATEPVVYGGMLRVLWKARRYESIVEACRTALKQAQATSRVILRSDLARALAQLGRWDEAQSEVDLAVKDAGDAERFAVRHLRVRLLIEAGRYEQAEAECQALLKEYTLAGEVMEVHYLLANIYSASKRLAQAEAQLTECLKIDAHNATVNNDLGYLWADQNKKLAEAEAMIRKAIEEDRNDRQNLLSLRPEGPKEFHDNACYIDSLGWVLFRRGQLEAARQELERAGALPDGDDPVIWDHLGDVYQALEQRAKAIEAWRKALDFYDQGKRRKIDERYRVLEKKVRGASSGHL
jgi:tetratricopeptide (TPR) repeat protein